MYLIFSPASEGRWTCYKQCSGQHYLIGYLTRSLRVEEPPRGFSYWITVEDSISFPSCSDIIGVRVMVLDCKERIPLLIPWSHVTEVLSWPVLFVLLKGRKNLTVDSGIQFLSFLFYLDKPRMWALRRYIRNQSQGGTGFQLGRSSGSDTHS